MGGGCSKMNEFLGRAGVPSMHSATFSAIEEQIGLWWGIILEQDMIEAAAVEKETVIRKGHFKMVGGVKVPWITVIIDGGWSKRSHKHSYIALSGVGEVIVAHTGKVIGMAESLEKAPPPHTCYKNWDESSAVMEPGIMVELFLNGKKRHGLLYLKVIWDGDSSVLHHLRTRIPGWGADIEKMECCNHVCKTSERVWRICALQIQIIEVDTV